MALKALKGWLLVKTPVVQVRLDGNYGGKRNLNDVILKTKVYFNHCSGCGVLKLQFENLGRQCGSLRAAGVEGLLMMQPCFFTVHARRFKC